MTAAAVFHCPARFEADAAPACRLRQIATIGHARGTSREAVARTLRTGREGKPQFACIDKLLEEIFAAPPPDLPDEDPAELQERLTKTIRARLWEIGQTPKLTPTERNRETAAAVVEWLHTRGRFYYHTERRDFAGCMFFDSARKLLLPVQGDAFLAWLADSLAVNRAERSFAFVQRACETEGLSERATAIEPATYWAATSSAIYLSNGPGSMVRILAARVEQVDNGTDGVLFPFGGTLLPWQLTEPTDPFETCALFRDVSATAPHGRTLFRLFACALPSDQRTKPQLVLSGTVGSGKTRLVRGLFELYGMPERIAAVVRNGEGDFWAAVDAGGLACFDNADTRVDWLADALAAAATAGTLEKRRLYTDADRVSLRARSWLCITSASPAFAADAGLADRLLVVRLNRRTGETAETVLSDEIRRHRDGGLSWICKTLSRALADRAPVPAGLNARHPDFARLAVRIGRAIGAEAEAVAALRAAELDKGYFNLENDWIGAAVLELVRNEPFAGTAGALLDALKAIEPDFDGKLSAKRLAKRLAKLWPHLENVLRAEQVRDGHAETLVYSLHPPDIAGYAGFETAFSGKSLTRENKGSFTERPFENRHNRQTTSPDPGDTPELPFPADLDPELRRGGGNGSFRGSSHPHTFRDRAKKL